MYISINILDPRAPWSSGTDASSLAGSPPVTDHFGPFRTQHPKNISNKWSVRKLFTRLEHFLQMFENNRKKHF